MTECEGCKALQLRLDAALKQLENALKRITELEARLAVHENAHTPSSAKRFKPQTSSDENAGKPGRAAGHEGTTRETPTPDKTIVALKDNCDECGSPLGNPAGFVTRVIEDIPLPQKTVVTEFKLGFYVCKCGKHNLATHEDCPEKGVFGFRAIAQVALLKYAGRLPCKLVCEALERDYGLRITPATVLAINSRASNAFEARYKAILKRVRNAKVVFADETGFRVAGVNYWLWIFVTDTEVLVVIRQSRAIKVLREVLGKRFNGTIVCDGHKSYSNFTTKIQRCWAHLLREAKHASEKSVEAERLYESLCKLYEKLTDALVLNPSMEERKRLRRNALETLKRLCKVKWKNPPTLKAATYLRNGLKHWLTFVTEDGVEPTNNRAERALREHVVLRKIIGGLRNPQGIRSHEVITTILATWRQREPEKQPYLRERLANAIKAS